MKGRVFETNRASRKTKTAGAGTTAATAVNEIGGGVNGHGEKDEVR